jgi:4-amino-4-deoxy-L-arabinose transferase-like glycosyltransferase
MNVAPDRDAADSAPAAQFRSRRNAWMLALVLCVAAIRLWRSPWSASDLSVVPDSVEYAVGAQRIATLGEYDIAIGPYAYPPRYLPWFSLLLAPAYALVPHELGIGIVPVFVLTLCAVGAAFVLGRELAGECGAVASALALVCFEEFRRDATKIMTDVPALAFALWSCVLYLRLRRGGERNAPWLLAGVLCAAAFALRLELLAVTLPFLVLALKTKQRRLVHSLSFSLPVIGVALGSAYYNGTTFGSWTRTGYQFWLPELDDRLANVLAPRFLAPNLAVLETFWVVCAIGFGILGVWRLLLTRSPETRGLLSFFVLGALPGSLFHFFYFYQDARFQLLSLAILCVFAGAALATFAPDPVRARAHRLLPLIAIAALALPASPEPVPYRRIAADTLARETPPNATIISAIDPVYLEPTVTRDTGRHIVAYSRAVDYAGRSVRVGWIWAGSCRPMIGVGLVMAFDTTADTVEPVIERVADEQTADVRAWIRKGEPVFLDHSFIPKDYPLERILGDDLELVRVKDYVWLSRVELKH